MTRLENLKKVISEVKTSKLTYISFVLLIIFWTIATFLYPLDIFLFPIYIIVFLLILSAPIYLIIATTHFVKNKEHSHFSILTKLYLPLLISFFYLDLISNFNNDQFEKTGKLIYSAMIEYQNESGNFPLRISEVDHLIDTRNLMFSWQAQNLYITNDSLLCRPANLMDRYFWDANSNKWIYDDF